MLTYGYVRVSTSSQNVERQIRAIKSVYPSAIMVVERYTGRTMDRPKWNWLMGVVKEGNRIAFDSVSRMARTADEGVEEYEKLYEAGIELAFVKEPQINTEVYREACKAKIPMTGTDVDVILEGVEKYMLILARKQIKIAFEQAEKEVDDLRQRTVEGIETARLSGKTLGRPKGRYITERERSAKNKMLRRAKAFGGDLTDADCMKIIGISRGTYYKYKKELAADSKNVRKSAKTL